MTTWILIVSYAVGATIGFEYAIPNLPSYEECHRVSLQIPAGRLADKTFKCIEVKR